MIYRNLGTSGVRVSPVCPGACGSLRKAIVEAVAGRLARTLRAGC